MTYSHIEPFADAFTSTFAPNRLAMDDNAPTQEILEYLQTRLAVHVQFQSKVITVRLIGLVAGAYRPTTGITRIEERRQFTGIYTSGRMLKELREQGYLGEYLNLFANYPHRVTRLDASIDVARDAAPIIKKLIRKYPKEINLTNKSVNTGWYLSERHDGVKSGSFEAGRRQKPTISAIVYDKSKERYDVAGEIIEPTTRYEMTFKKAIGMTLKDVYNPASIFWSHCTPLMIKPPKDFQPYEPFGEYTQWVADSTDQPTAIEQLSRLMETSPDVQRMLRLVGESGSQGIELVQDKLDMHTSPVGRVPRTTEQDSAQVLN